MKLVTHACFEYSISMKNILLYIINHFYNIPDVKTCVEMGIVTFWDRSCSAIFIDQTNTCTLYIHSSLIYHCSYYFILFPLPRNL